MSEVGQSESVVVICGDGEVFVCAVDQSDLTITHSLTVGSKVRELIRLLILWSLFSGQLLVVVRVWR